jgi:DNA-binding response OmpR family regulator
MPARDVLIVEDDYAFRWALAMRLQRANIDVDVAEDGAEAADLLNQHDYRCVVLDLKLPRVNGEALVEALERREPQPNVLVVSAFPDATARLAQRGSALIKAMYQKPVDVDVLAAEVVAATS